MILGETTNLRLLHHYLHNLEIWVRHKLILHTNQFILLLLFGLTVNN